MPIFLFGEYMAGQSISELTSAQNLTAQDFVIIARNGNNYKVGVDTLFQTSVVPPAHKQDYDTITTSGAIDVNKYITLVTTTNAQVNLTLGVGIPNQQKKIVFFSKGTQNVVITPVQLLGFSTITLSNTGSNVTLEYINNKWVVVGSFAASLS